MLKQVTVIQKDMFIILILVYNILSLQQNRISLNDTESGELLQYIKVKRSLIHVNDY